MDKKSVLEQGLEIVEGARDEDYGNFRDNLGRIAKYWSAYLDRELTAEDVSIMMMLLKIARLSATPGHKDTQVDIAGYLRLLEKLQDTPPITISDASGMTSSGSATFYLGAVATNESYKY